jgi:hypothetical protein
VTIKHQLLCRAGTVTQGDAGCGLHPKASFPCNVSDAVGAGEQLLSKLATGSLSKAKAQQHFEQQQHRQDTSLFGPGAPHVTDKQVTEAQQHALLLSHNERTPGFAHVLQSCKAGLGPHASTVDTSSDEKQQPAAFESPLLRLLRRVSLWWHYRVMFDPLEQLVALSSSYELLFQLMTPHQQLSCMADILLVLACPALEEQRWAWS